ncbi:MAG: lamin tail domain-containing protein [Rubrivivax sp.]|nr:lamin tail domain-containing protein [Rubrivivax sp.]
MNLGVLEAQLLRTLGPLLRGGPVLHAGPLVPGAASGLRPEVYVHAQRFDDHGGVTADGAAVAPQPWAQGAQAAGEVQARPAHVTLQLHCVCGAHAQAQSLAALVAAPALLALRTLREATLSDPAEPWLRLVFAEHHAVLAGVESRTLLHEGVVLHVVTLTLRLDGFLHLRLAQPGGLPRRPAYAAATPQMDVVFDPDGPDLAREHVRLTNDTGAALDLGGWTLQDAAARPHRYTFQAPTLLPAGATLRLWTGRGSDGPGDRYWGRRQAVWNNTGDVALLLDPDGVERARFVCEPGRQATIRPRRKQARSR